MKKIVILLLAITMLLTLVLTVSATGSGLTPYDSAETGDLLYKVNFNGETGVFDPQPRGNFTENFDVIVGDDGNSLTIRGTADGEDETVNFYGGVINGLDATSTTSYAMIYKVRANGTPEDEDEAKNNSLGIGGLIADADTNKFYYNYSNHSTGTLDGDISMRRAAVSSGDSKLYRQPNDYVKFNTIDAYDVDADGFVTMRIDFVGKSMTTYILKDGAQSELDESNWIVMQNFGNMSVNDTNDKICFMVYAFYNCIDTTVKDVGFYKGTPIASAASSSATSDVSSATSPTEDPAPQGSTPTSATAVVTTDATTEAATEERGCRGTLALSAIALIPAISAGVVIAKKKKSDE